MKRYRFRLDSVLRVRRVEEERAAQALADAQRVHAAAAEAQRDAEHSYAHRPSLRTQHSTASYLAQRALADAGAASVMITRQRTAVAADGVGERRDEWSTAAGRVTGLERLDERGRAEHRQDELRDELVAVDDLVTGRHGRGDGGIA